MTEGCEICGDTMSAGTIVLGKWRCGDHVNVMIAEEVESES